MISLCSNREVLENFLGGLETSPYIRETIRLYLLSYGTEYDFCQYYVQFLDDGSVNSVMVRYNSQVFAIIGDDCIGEAAAFLSGFGGCEIIADNPLLSEYFSTEACFVMQKIGTDNRTQDENISLAESAGVVSRLVAKSFDDNKAEDFFLNTAHQMRHNILSVAGFYSEKELVSVVSFTNLPSVYSLITFVFTDNYFRGKGIASGLLSFVCKDIEKTYLLLCQKHNVEFYEKCGFEQESICYRFEL